MATLDLRRSHLHRPYGDLLAVWAWCNDYRALYLMPRYRRGAPWFIVLEPASHEWNDQDPAMLALLPQRSIEACLALGMTPTPQNARRIIAIVNDAIPELLAMPSRPPADESTAAYGHASVLANGKEIEHHEIRAANDGVEYVPDVRSA